MQLQGSHKLLAPVLRHLVSLAVSLKNKGLSTDSAKPLI